MTVAEEKDRLAPQVGLVADDCGAVVFTACSQQ